jgi:hypothetical protein
MCANPLEPPPPSTTAILAGLTGTGAGVVAQALSIKFIKTGSNNILNFMPLCILNILPIILSIL